MAISSRAGFPMRFGGLGERGRLWFRRNRDGKLSSFRLGGRVNTLPTVTRFSDGWSAIGDETTRAVRVYFPSPLLSSPVDNLMNVFELTRALIDIESITNNEERVGNYL